MGENGKYVITNSNGEKVTGRTLNKWWDMTSPDIG